MKYLKMLGLAGVAAMSLLAFAGGVASATTLEVEGVPQNKSVTFTASLKAGTSSLLKDTFNEAFERCTSSHMHGSTTSSTTSGNTTHNSFTGGEITGSLTEKEGGLSFSNCERGTTVVHKSGTLHIKWTSGTNGTVSSSEAEWTVPSPYGALTCKTGAGTHLGTLTGVASGHATLDVNAYLNCSGISSRWEATYTITSPTGLGVTDARVPPTGLEVGGVTQTKEVFISSTLKAGTSTVLKDTFGFTSNTCTSSEVNAASVSPFVGETVTGAVGTVSFSECEREPVTVLKAGTLHVRWISGTNGTVSSSGAEVKTGSPFGTLICTTGTGTHLGTLTGVASGHATMDINAALSCSGVSSKWEATYTVTSPTGLGVTDASAPTTGLEVEGVTQTTEVSISSSLKSGTTGLLKDTFGFPINTCTSSDIGAASVSPFIGKTVTGAVGTLSFSKCEREPVTVLKAGTLHFQSTSGTNGTVSSSGAEVKTGSPFGTLICTTGTGTHLGTLTGVASGHATMDINAALSCSGVSSKWEATYTITSPTGLGIVS